MHVNKHAKMVASFPPPPPHPNFLYPIPYSGKLSRDKAFANFKVLWLFVNVFFVKFGGVTSFVGTSE